MESNKTAVGDDMFDEIPPPPWKVAEVNEQKNTAYIRTDRNYPKGYCVAEVHAKYLGQLPKIAAVVGAAPDLLKALKGAQSALRKAMPLLPAGDEAIYCGEWLDEVNAAIAKTEVRTWQSDVARQDSDNVANI